MEERINHLVTKLQNVSKMKIVSLSFAAMSGMSFTMSNFMVQVTIALISDQKISTTQLVFCRSAVQLFFILPLLIIFQIPIGKCIHDVMYLIPMGIAGYVNILVTYAALNKIPLSDTLLITFTSPFFCALFSYCFLKESIHILDVMFGLLSFVGVVIVARPSIIFGQTNPKEVLFQQKNLSPSASEMVYLTGALYAILGAIFLALYFVLTRLCCKSHALSPILAIFYPSLIGTIISPILLIVLNKERFVFPSDWHEAFSMISIGVYSMLALCFLTVSLKHENATIVNLIRNLDVVYAFLLQYWILNVTPNIWSICGGIIIVSATFCVVLIQWWKWKKNTDNEQ